MGCDRGFWSWWRESLSDTKTWCYAISAEERKCECEMLSISTTMCFWYRYQCGVKKRTSRWTQIERIKFHEKKCTHEHATFTRIEFIFAFHWILNSHSMSSSVRVFFFLFLPSSPSISHPAIIRSNIKKLVFLVDISMIQQLFPCHQIWQSQSSSLASVASSLTGWAVKKRQNSHTHDDYGGWNFLDSNWLFFYSFYGCLTANWSIECLMSSVMRVTRLGKGEQWWNYNTQ